MRKRRLEWYQVENVGLDEEREVDSGRLPVFMCAVHLAGGLGLAQSLVLGHRQPMCRLYAARSAVTDQTDYPDWMV